MKIKTNLGIEVLSKCGLQGRKDSGDNEIGSILRRSLIRSRVRGLGRLSPTRWLRKQAGRVLLSTVLASAGTSMCIGSGCLSRSGGHRSLWRKMRWGWRPSRAQLWIQGLNKSVGVERLQVHGMFAPNEEFNFSSILRRGQSLLRSQGTVGFPGLGFPEWLARTH